MNFVSEVLNSIPAVGHVKGVIHYAVGDKEGGNRAMYQASRTTGVVAGSVIGGITGGPLGAVGGAIAGGTAVDSYVSLGGGKPVGVISNLADTCDDIARGENPTCSIAKAALTLTVDGIGGAFTGGVGSTAFVGQVGNAVAESAMTAAVQEGVKSSAKELGLTTVKTVVKTTAKVVGKEILREAATEIVVVGATEGTKRILNEVLEEERREGKRQKAKSQSKQNDKPSDSSGRGSTHTEAGNKAEVPKEKPKASGSATGGSGDQPPRKNQKPSFHYQENGVSELLKQIFDSVATELADIRVGGQKIFRNLSRAQREYLVTQIYPLIIEGSAKTVFETLRELLSQLLSKNLLSASEITYVNFLSFLSAATTIVREKLGELVHSRFKNVQGLEVRREKALDAVRGMNEALAREVVEMFSDQQVRSQITREQQRTDPCFRDFYAALSHWLKHRGDFVGPTGEYLTIEQYFGNGREMLEILRRRYAEVLKDLMDGNRPSIGFARVLERLDLRRLTIVLKRLGKVILSTIYIKDDYVDDDEDGDEIFQDEKNPKTWHKRQK